MKTVLNKGETEHKTISILGSVTSALTVLFYILFPELFSSNNSDPLLVYPLSLISNNKVDEVYFEEIDGCRRS